jgi:ABC-type molybdate transport system substrate-binding protein
VVTKGDPNPLVKTFIEFLCSSEANEVIKEQFFVPIK